MKNLFRSGKLFLLLLAATTTALGQAYTGSNPNIATSKFALASDSTAGHEPGMAVDGNVLTDASIPGSAPAWISIDLGGYFYIDGYEIDLPDAGELPKVFRFQGSTNGTGWTTFGNGSASEAKTYGYDLALSGPVRWVQIEITSKDLLATIAEIRVYGYAEVPPTPPTAHPPTNVAAYSFTANWSERTIATGYVLSVASDAAFTNQVPGYPMDVDDVTSFNVTGLDPVTTYYYRARAYNFVESSSYSNTISLTTQKAPQTITFDSLAAYTYGDSDFDLGATASSGLAVSYSSSDENVATVSGTTVTIVGTGTTSITASQDGDAVFLAAGPVSWDLVINQKELTVTDAVAADKIYDGSTDAVINGTVLNGVIGLEDVTLADATAGTFAQAGVGTGIAVSTTMTLAGTDMANYSLTQPVDITADITVKELTVSGAAAENKVYDGTMDAVISGASLDGVVGADDVVLNNAAAGTFAQSGIGTGIAVSTSMTLGGTESANYSLTPPAGMTADITAGELTVTADDMSREACASNPVFTVSYSGFAGAEDAGILTSVPTASCLADESSAAGPYDITVTGGSADNYTLVYVTGTLTVTPDVTFPVLVVKDITVQLDDGGNASITPADVVTDASDNCSISDTTLSQSAFTVSDVGTVSVTVTVSDLSGNSTVETITVTVESTIGVDEILELTVDIYPNPTSGVVMLDVNSPVDGLKVMDMTGRTIITRASIVSDETIDLSAQSNGIYIFQLKVGDELKYVRVVKR